MSRIARILAGLIGAAMLAGAAAVPAQAAASDAFVVGSVAFDEGKASDRRPEDQAELAYCAGYWNVWGDALADEQVSEEDLSALSPILQPLSAPFQALAIFGKLEESDTLDAEVDEGRAEARKFLEETLAGNQDSAQSLFWVLGGCSV